MLILDKLWDGEVLLADRDMGRGEDYVSRLREVDRARKALMRDLTPEQQGLLQIFDDRIHDLAAYLERDAFFVGCRLGGTLVLDILPGV